MNAWTQEKAAEAVATLDTVMAYENRDVVDKFMEHWDVSDAEAVEIFQELKKWLWLSADSIDRKARGEDVPPLAITHSMTLLDEMWHAFILFTNEYHVFCKRYFGFYLHHAPTTSREKAAAKAEMEQDPEGFKARIEAEFAAQFSYTYDLLGEETLVKWYSEWTDRMTPEHLARLRKAPGESNEHVS